MLARFLLAVACAIFVPGLAPTPALAECMDWPPLADQRLEVTYAFTATVTAASNRVDPADVNSAAFDWHVELRIDRVYRGRLPGRLTYNGWAERVPRTPWRPTTAR
jgi:hypothetical protein